MEEKRSGCGFETPARQQWILARWSPAKFLWSRIFLRGFVADGVKSLLLGLVSLLVAYGGRDLSSKFRLGFFDFAMFSCVSAMDFVDNLESTFVVVVDCRDKACRG